ncbi:hypothetical protein HK105_206371 [Polyrhizophydium stewartii]|uniref:CheW-like domain-containing protein n=1 Tax=Polyrhizophydium stewartii TaxID=2732419 RepID=A0ABR4N3Q5_9FUNG
MIATERQHGDSGDSGGGGGGGGSAPVAIPGRGRKASTAGAGSARGGGGGGSWSGRSAPRAQSFTAPSAPHTHPLLAFDPRAPPAARAHTQLVPFILLNGRAGGLFVPRAAAAALGLDPLGPADSCYGTVTRFSPLGVVLFNRERIVEHVFELPEPFENTKYAGGIIDLDLIHTLGLSVMCDRGMVYVWDPEHTPYHTAEDILATTNDIEI